ncbi:UbiH/UbiF/VisC/COQ6 family ubiquinone biosynthesis hydroxylase [Zymomonas mobilis]|uniref:UbiH/UbiF/VisC/COQ6 family ubiquinone biosynthesis hydroxylase n=1 Tax=Zymomonas mobilis TaxID=542 RepID=UPI0021C26B91|nr:UbiH/UbiF/VisC/COQ6 family ubiquinone biosynthesis hydroxylase [Zymomonas mobilis]MCP9308219.1 UbiH/UbiF/VisC/COQ6 family ubiquinone biosynthesis hydroxylase [Zymomonas mobilis]
MHLKADVLILGGGFAGMTLAVALDRYNISSIVVDTSDPIRMLEKGYDGRTTAIASSCWKLLEAIGLKESLEGKGCPIHTVRTSDQLKAPDLCFESSKDNPSGYMLENRYLRQALYEATLAAEHVTLLQPAHAVETERRHDGVSATLADGRKITASLLVGAEGRASPTRQAAGINLTGWNYNHAAVICTLFHEKPHHHIAHEIFYPKGPVALLPMQDQGGRHRSALVWTVPRQEAEAVKNLPERPFFAEVTRLTGGILGKLDFASHPTAYPLSFQFTSKMTDLRLALIADAAHGIHPIAGQGLNLGLRDVAALTEILVEGRRLGMDLGDAILLERYARWRSLDNFAIAAGTDALVRIFAVPGKVASFVRRVGFKAINNMGFIKNFFLAEARGDSGKLPRLLTGNSL